MLRICLLGPAEIRRGQVRLELPPSRKARALLAYLIATGRKHRRDRLTDLLWDVADDPKGGLRWCLSKIRPLVDEPGRPRILADRETVEFSPERAEVDLFVLREGLKREASSLTLEELEPLAGLFRGPFLEGLELPDYDGFQAWLVAEREHVLRQQGVVLRAVLERLADDVSAALPYARRLVQSDPLDEDSRSQLAGLLIRLGRHAEARQLIESGKRLAAELGAGASGALEEAERALARASKGRLAAETSSPRRSDVEPIVPAEESRPNWVPHDALVGREQESARMRRILERCRDEREGAVLLVAGAPGVGKSRLLAELAAHAASIRGTVLLGRSYEVEARRPYGPWIDALGSLHPSSVGDVLGEKLSPLLRGIVDEDHGREGKDRLFRAVVEMLAARAHSAPPVLLGFDDLQWCDKASAELLHYAVRMTRHRSFLVLLTARSGELPDNEPVMRVLRGFRREGWIEELQIAPLSREDTALLAGLVSPAVDPGVIFEESAGNPLYAIELARASDRSGDAVHPTLAGLIRDRIDRLPTSAGEVLRWAAVLGTRFSLARLEALVSIDFDELMRTLEMLERHGLLQSGSAEGSPETYGFTHNVVRRSVYDDLSEPRRRLMHWHIARMLEQETDSPATAAELAHRAALAGRTEAAARASLAAGRYCLRIYANGDALAFARSGMSYSEALPEPERVGLQIELLEVSLEARRPENVEGTAKRLEELAEQALAHGDAEHARLGFHLLSYLRWEGGEWSDAKRHSLRAELVARGADARERIVAMAEAARCLALLERDLGQAEALALEAQARAANTGVETAAISDALGMLRFHQGAWDEAAGLFHSARELSLRERDRLGEFRALEHLIVLELERQESESARELSRDLTALAAKLREGSEAPFARCLAALAAEACGQDMSGELETALESLRMADAKHRLAYALLRAACGDLRRGDIEKARARGEEALGLAEILGRPSETAMAHVVLLRCAVSGGADGEIRRHREALGRTNMDRMAAHVRRAAEQIESAV